MTTEERMPLELAAQKLGTTGLALLLQIKRGRLDGVEVGGTWYVTAESLAAFRAQAAAPAAHICRGHCQGGCASKG